MVQARGLYGSLIRFIESRCNGAELANWYATYGDRLLSKNIRKALGQTEVNRQIVATGTESPEHFWYFNNGVTVLCQSVRRKPLGGGGKSNAVLECSVSFR